MPKVSRRANVVKQLLNVRSGPGAAVLPANVSRIHMDFPSSIIGGHQGAKKFWRENLPRLKYHNPAVPMFVNRTKKNNEPSFLTIFFRTTGAPATPAQPARPAKSSSGAIRNILLASSAHDRCPLPSPEPNERVAQISMKYVHTEDIFKRFIVETGAKVLRPTEQDIKDKRELEAWERESSESRAMSQRLNNEKKRERAILEHARAAAAGTDRH